MGVRFVRDSPTTRRNGETFRMDSSRFGISRSDPYLPALLRYWQCT
jgi:hypothetical protein